MVFRMSMSPEPLLPWPEGSGSRRALTVLSLVAVLVAVGSVAWFVFLRGA